jgi:hypothetical protein
MGKSLHTNYSKEKKVNFLCVFSKSNHFTVFLYIYNLMMTGKWEMRTEFSEKA